MRPLAYPRQALDFLARTPVVAPGLAPRWSIPTVGPPPRVRLLAVRDGLVFVEDGRSVVEVDPTLDPGPAGAASRWRRHALELADVGPGFDSEPVLVTHDGLVHRWSPGEDPRPLYQAGSGALAVTGLPGNRLLLQRYEPGTPETLLVDLDSGQGPGAQWSGQGPGAQRRGQVRWRQEATVPFPMVDGQHIFFRPLTAPDGLFAVSLDDGRVRWRVEAVTGGLGDLTGWVGGKLWLSTRSGKLLALDAGSGEPAPPVDVPDTAHPRGVLDGDGRLHVCNGVRYHVLDLAAGGRLLASHRWPQTERGPGMVSPGAVLPAADGRLFFGDDRGGLYVSEPGDPAQPALLWQGAAPLVTLGASQGRLVVLDASGVLHVL